MKNREADGGSPLIRDIPTFRKTLEDANNLAAVKGWRTGDRLHHPMPHPQEAAWTKDIRPTRWRPTSDGRVQIEGKDELKARLGRSPDRADAVSMAFYRLAAGGREPGDYGITVGSFGTR